MEFIKLRTYPKRKDIKAIEKAVDRFVKESNRDNTPLDNLGFYTQTLQLIAQAILSKNENSQFWIALHKHEVIAYSLCNVSLDVDNTLCYWITQTYVNPIARCHPIIKIWRQQLFDEAKRLGCKHIIIPSSRNTKAYQRWLGEGWHPYVTLIKKDI